LAEAEITLAEGEAAINRGIEAITRMVANDRAAAGGGGRLDRDYRIERLEFYEAEAARDVSRMRRLVDRILAGALARRQEDAVSRFVEALRDARWQMMALRANFEADSRDGPTFNNAAEMHHYLAASCRGSASPTVTGRPNVASRTGFASRQARRCRPSSKLPIGRT
jgi:hypothetical protein